MKKKWGCSSCSYSSSISPWVSLISKDKMKILQGINSNARKRRKIDQISYNIDNQPKKLESNSLVSSEWSNRTQLYSFPIKTFINFKDHRIRIAFPPEKRLLGMLNNSKDISKIYTQTAGNEMLAIWFSYRVLESQTKRFYLDYELVLLRDGQLAEWAISEVYLETIKLLECHLRLISPISSGLKSKYFHVPI